MPATLTTTSHGVVTALSTAVTAKRTGRTAAGWPTITLAESQAGGEYGDTYAFTNGTGTNATTYMRYGSEGGGLYQTHQQYTTFDINGLSNPSFAISSPRVGFANTAVYTMRDGINQYRSLSFKPTSGSAYGVHIYQLFISAASAWRTVDAEIFIKPENKPSAFNENQAASTLFMYYEGRVSRQSQWYDGYRWMYPQTPYTGWAGSTPLANNYDNTALMSRLVRGNSSYTPDLGSGGVLSNSSSGIVDSDIFAGSCLPMQLGVWDLDTNSNAKLASPFVLRHRMRPIGTAGSDFVIGPALEPGFVVTVSPTEKYWSLGASLFLRQS